MSRRSVALLIEDILEAIEKIERYARDLTLEAFLDDEKTADAVVRNLEIVGEAASRLPGDFKAKYPEVEWAQIVGLRHRIVHGYFGVDLNIIWQIVQGDLPAFKRSLERIREKLDARGSEQ